MSFLGICRRKFQPPRLNVLLKIGLLGTGVVLEHNALAGQNRKHRRKVPRETPASFWRVAKYFLMLLHDAIQMLNPAGTFPPASSCRTGPNRGRLLDAGGSEKEITRCPGHDSESSTLTGRFHWRRVVILFRDTGPGIKEPHRVLTAFYTTKPVGKGTGAGVEHLLCIVQAWRKYFATTAQGARCFA